VIANTDSDSFFQTLKLNGRWDTSSRNKRVLIKRIMIMIKRTMIKRIKVMDSE
jgi:hypothetical protein